MSARDRELMVRALAIAHAARFHTAPNPAVGCVIASNGDVVAEAATGPVGALHAEAGALAIAGARARGATAYVTLEPCNHQGRTPPCSKALIESGIARVVVAIVDPNAVASGGVEQLRKAGIAVEVGLCGDQARWQLRGFLSRVERGRPWVRLKIAASLDGRTSMASGESRWITGEPARADVQWLRAESDCVLTGIGTLIADDPAMTVRLSAADLGAAQVRQPLRVLLDTHLRCPADARWLFEPGDRLIYTTADPGSRELAADVRQIATADGEVSLVAALEDLAGREVNFVHLEAGGTLSGAALQAGVVDEVVVYLAPVLLGDAAQPLARLPGLSRLAEAPRFAPREVSQVGDDLRLVLTPRAGA